MNLLADGGREQWSRFERLEKSVVFDISLSQRFYMQNSWHIMYCTNLVMTPMDDTTLIMLQCEQSLFEALWGE